MLRTNTWRNPDDLVSSFFYAAFQIQGWIELEMQEGNKKTTRNLGQVEQTRMNCYGHLTPFGT